ncbi:putative Cell growth-regulating nucleolar protein [Operophtera brumata]|uniref:Putative Cell growth-regulating nucleolar protein n=1 Tax=Operophtera brumata TaxID=104452 RepID=A0A0L7LIV2_OPEBR|nr:putative Cell growth-regulating nucleolar protein [Operophtera brumata]
MVVFTCGHCGESLQKPKVEKHYTTTKCRNRSPNLSCMDCFKDFLGSAYEEHTKCVTEEERYSAKGFVAKEKKGEKKQNTWVDLVQSVLDEQKDAPRNVLRIIESISKHQNTPRKKPKFVNFVKNVCGHKTNQADIDQAWDLISVKLSALSNANNRNQNQNKTIKEETETNENEDITENGDDSVIKQENGHDGETCEESQDTATTSEVVEEKLSKKQLKEKKKREKYQAELQKAEVPLSESDEPVESKKGKKKNRTKSTNQDEEQDSKKNKRKRQDTVNSNSGAADTNEHAAEPAQNGNSKPQKKKGKLELEEAEESICLHEQNVAKIGELAMSDKFNWHAVILSVLEKKGNELPFKRLQKKVLGEYSETTGREVDDRIADKFIKKLKSLPNVRVDKNRVLIID